MNVRDLHDICAVALEAQTFAHFERAADAQLTHTLVRSVQRIGLEHGDPRGGGALYATTCRGDLAEHAGVQW